MAKVNIDALVKRGQEKGITLSEDTKNRAWRGSFVYDGESLEFDDPTPDGVLDECEAALEIVSKDDTYDFEWNEDLERFVVTVNGLDKTFQAAQLRNAFAEAKAAVMAKAKPAEVQKRRGKPAPEPVEVKSEAVTEAESYVYGGKPTSPPVGIQEAPVASQPSDAFLILAIEIHMALGKFIDTRVRQANAPKGNGADEVEEFVEPEIPTNEPAPTRPRRASRKSA